MSKCKFYDEDCLKCGCNATEEEWYEGSTVAGEVCEMAEVIFMCPVCSNGMINPTFDATLSCDRCTYEVDYKEFEEKVRYSEEYLKRCEEE